jgi:putative transposase
MTWKPLHFIVVAVAGWMNRQQQQVIEYHRTENQVLREKFDHRKIVRRRSLVL